MENENENEINDFIDKYCNTHSNLNLRSKCNPQLIELVYSIFILLRMDYKTKLKILENIWKSFKSQKPLALKQIFEESNLEIKINDFEENARSDLKEILRLTIKKKSFIKIKENLIFFFMVWFLIREKIPNENKNLQNYNVDANNLKNPYVINFLQEISFMCNINFFFLFVNSGVIIEKLMILGNDNQYNFIIIKKNDCLILFEFSQNSTLSIIKSNDCIECDKDCIENSYKLINCDHIICKICFSKLKKNGDIECEKCNNNQKFDNSVLNEYSKCKICLIDYLKINLLKNKCRSCFIHNN